MDRTAAERQRRCRIRRKLGRDALLVDVDLFKFTDTCIEQALLTEADALDKRKVAAAASEVLNIWAIRHAVTR